MSDQSIDLANAKILLVDDQLTNLKVLRQALESADYNILAATSGARAIDIAQRAHPDLILLDVMMPEMDGYETCQKLKQDPVTAGIPVLFITARTDTESVVQGFAAGSVDYLTKPFQTDEVLIRVATHLRIDRLTRELAASNQALTAANEQIQEASRRKSRFLASMAHELRTPMNAIIGFTRMVQRKSGDVLPPPQQENLAKVQISADRLLNLVNEILDLSKIEAGQMQVHAAPCDLEQLVAECCETLSPLVGSEVELSYAVDEGIGQAHTDAARLRQIIVNLVGNALKFTEKGRVRVCVEADQLDGNALIVLAVSDTGTGIPAADLATIFEEFRQVGGSVGEHQGTGLGLSITQSLVQLLGGTIGVESESGQGSIFTVRIPAVYPV